MADKIAASALPEVVSVTTDKMIVVRADNTVRKVPTPLADLASTAPGMGLTLVNTKQSSVSAASRPAQEKLNEIEVSVLDWVLSQSDRDAVRAGTFTGDLLPSVQLARAHLEIASDYRGGVLKLPRGIHKLNGALDFTCGATLLHGITLQGDGILNTVLDFSGAAVGTDGVTFNHGAHFAVKDLVIANAKRDGLVIGRGATTGGPNYASFFDVDNVRVQGCGQDGVAIVNAYLGSMRRVWAKANGRNGISLGGFHTALTVQNCEASENVAAGWAVNGVAYSTFEACGADENGTQGWALSNLQGVTFNACGAESNQRDGFLLYTSDASATGLNSQTSDIRGVEFMGCYGLANSKAAAGTYATFLNANTANGRPIRCAIRGGVAHPFAAGDRALILAGASGAITLIKDGFDDAAFSTADSTSGTVEVQNRAVAGRRCLLELSADKLIATGVQTLVDNFSGTPIANDLGATFSVSSITVPRGVSKVRVSAGMVWQAAADTGWRVLKMFKNGVGFVGMAQDQRYNTGSLNMQAIQSAVVSVVEGDVFTLLVEHTGGANRTLTKANGSWFCLEAVS